MVTAFFIVDVISLFLICLQRENETCLCKSRSAVRVILSEAKNLAWHAEPRDSSLRSE